jgi:uncharacterized membrane protein YeaQ/YmgE (transglycosylase-associated protein family)
MHSSAADAPVALAAELQDALGDLAGSVIVQWIVLGLVAGVVAKILLPGRDPGGVLGTIVIGVAGAFLGGWLSAEFFDRPVSGDVVDPALWVAAVGGSLVLLILYRLLFGHSRERR